MATNEKQVETRNQGTILSSEEVIWCERRTKLVESLRAFHGKEFDSPGNDHLHPCYKCNCPCTCKNKVVEELGAARASMSVGFW